MSKKSNRDKVKTWRSNVKEKAIKAFGGKCARCGYNKCTAAFDFHHISPSEKEKTIAALLANPKAITKIITELSKCVLLCSNCHRELHANVWDISSLSVVFDPNVFKKKVEETHNICRVCGKSINKKLKFCSHKCASYSRMKVDWDNIRLDEYIAKKIPLTTIGKLLGVSDNAVRKHAKKLGLL